MKTKGFFFLTLLLSSYISLSQVPQGFNYQAVVRNGAGAVIANQSVPVRITIQTSLTGGDKLWEETHSITTDKFGVMTLVIGTGIRTGGSALSFSDVDWASQTLFLKTEIQYPGPGFTEMGTTQLWSVPYSMVAGELGGPVDKLGVEGTTDDMEEALFEVKNKNGQTVFAVYNEGVRIYVDDGDAKGVKGGFAIGGFGQTKGTNQDFFIVNPDSIRAYIDTNPSKGVKGGFAIGGFGTVKEGTEEYLRVTRDSTRIYLNNTDIRGPKGGFAIGGFGQTKGIPQDYFIVSPDSIRAYIDTAPVKGAKGGFAIGGFGTVKESGDEYLRVTSDSVKVSKSLLIPRLTMEERDNLPFVPGEALIIFNMTEGCMQIYKNNVWSNIWCFNCAPDFIIQPVDQIICSGENAVFFVSATGTNLNYQWQVSYDSDSTWNNISNGGSNPAYAGAKGYTLTLSNIPLEYNNYRYRCTVTGSCLPNITSNVATLNVGSTPPVIATQPEDQQISTDCSVSFNTSSPGYGISYRWQQSSDGGTTWSNISDGGTSPVYSGTTTDTLSLSNVPSGYINNKYHCIVSNLCGENAISNAGSIINVSPVITVQPEDKLVYFGQNITFNISTSGSSFNYKWQESIDNGVTWSNLTDGGSNPAYSGVITASLKLANVPLVYNDYKYRCTVSHYCLPDSISNAVTLSVATPVPVTDIDGNTYSTVAIGSQLWMAENLKTTKYRNGDLIGTTTPSDLDIRSEPTPKYQWAWAGIESYAATYGRLYTLYAVEDSRDVCPTGWHVSNDAEWETLTDYLINNGEGFGYVARSIASTWGWGPGNGGVNGLPREDPVSNNSSGFNAPPGGLRVHDGMFLWLGQLTHFWSPGYGLEACTHLLDGNGSDVFRSNLTKKFGAYVRCLKD